MRVNPTFFAMNIENKNIQVATGSPRTISVHLVDAAGAPVTSGVAVELMLTAPLTGAPRIIPAVPQNGTYTITIPADLAPVTNHATGEPIPWHYALRAGASAAVARGSFLSGELHLLPAVLAGDLASPISLAATYDPASASVSFAAFASPTPGGVSEDDLVTLGVLTEKTEMRSCDFFGWGVDTLSVKTVKKLEFDLVKPISGTVVALVMHWRGESYKANIMLDHVSGTKVFNDVDTVPMESVNTPNGNFVESKFYLPEIVTVHGLYRVIIEFPTAMEVLLAKNAASKIENGIFYNSDELGDCEPMVEPPALGVLGERAETVRVAASGSRCTIQARVMTEEEGYFTESRNAWRFSDPLAAEANFKADAEYAANGRPWSYRRLYYYDEPNSSWWHCGWEIVIPADAREIVENAFTIYAEALADLSGGLYSVDIRIFNHD